MIGIVVAALWAVMAIVALSRHREGRRLRLGAVAVAVLTGGALAVAIGARDAAPAAALVVGVLVALVAGLLLFRSQYRSAAVVDRAPMQWVVWGVVVFAAVS